MFPGQFKWAKTSIQVILSFFFLAATLLLNDPAGPFIEEKPPLILKGRDGFRFFLLRDETRQPMKSMDGSPLYQGLRDKLTVGGSYLSLKNHFHLEVTPEEKNWQRAEWIKDSFKISMNSETVAGLLRYFQNHPDQFKSFFSGMTESRAQVFYSLLFSDEVILTEKDLSDLARTPFNRIPAPVKVPIAAEAPGFLKHASIFLETLSDIQTNKFIFSIKNRSIFIDPKSKVFSIRLVIDKASLEGPLLQIGRVSTFLGEEAWRFGDILPFLDITGLLNFYDTPLILRSAVICQLELKLDLQFIENSKDYWNISIAHPLELKSLEIDPRVRMDLVAVTDFDKKDERTGDICRPLTEAEKNNFHKNPPFTIEAQKKIQTTLMEALNNAFATSIFSNNLAFQVPIRSPDYERQSGDVLFESRLAKMQPTSNGLDLTFDSRLVLKNKARCIDASAAYLENLSKFNLDSANFEKHEVDQQWSLESVFPHHPEWVGHNTQNNSEKVAVEFSQAGVEVINTGLFLAGFYCPSTRAWWPRPASTPLIEYRPLQPITIEMNESEWRFKSRGEMISYLRDQKMRSEKFTISKRRELSFEIPFRKLRDNEVHVFYPQNITFGNIEATDNEMIANLWNSVSKDFDSLEFFPKMIEDYFKSFAQVTRVDLKKDGIKLLVDPLNFDWFPVISRPAKEMPKVIPLTQLENNPPLYVNQPFVHLKWQPRSDTQVFYSWRLKTENDFSDWTVFQSENYTTLSLDEPGHYEFQLKSMNRNFEIQDLPVTHEFFYEKNIERSEPFK